MKQTNIEDLYPLSPMQQGMLFHSLYSPSNGMYFEQLICDLHGELNIAAFEQAWQKLATRHPILRTAFFWEELNEPLQVVHRQVHIPLEQHDWHHLSTKQQEENLASFIQAQRVQGFKLSTAPLMRLAVLRMAEDRYAFIWNFHHILLDAWSVSLLLNEVFALYDALCENVDAHLEHSPPYRNYITWLQRQDLPQAEKFWRETLKGFTDPLALKIKPILGKISDSLNEYSEQQKQLSVTTTEALKSFARGHQLTLNTLIQAAWALLLSRYHGGEEDIVFGTTVSGRSTELSGMESMIGLFINTLPVREKILPQRPLLSWLREFQARQIQLRQYEYCPLLKIQEWSEVPRGTSLFDTIVVFENYPVNASWQRNKNLHIHDVRTIGWTNYSLTMMAIPHPVLSLRLTYNVQHFDAATVARMLEHFQILLEGMLANPRQQLADLPLLTQAEQQQLLAWNQTQRDYPDDQTVVDLFQAQVEKTPEAVAVVFEGQQLSYQQLNTQANQLAHYLISLGVQAETLVGICVERSLEMMIGLLGILKAGGAYVPLDPDYPAERLQFMLADAAVPVLLSQSYLKERLPTVQTSVVHLDTDWEQIATYSDENPLRQGGPTNLAYVIYTSGSTGKPKGVMIEHRSLFNHMQWMQRTFAFTAQDKVFQKTPFSFDASIWEFYAPLLVGGTLVIAKPGGHQEPEYLVQTIQDHHITILQLVPSLLRILLTQTEFQTQIPLRYLFCGGEPLTPELRQAVNTHYPQTQLYNLYGPTEATIDTTYWFCDKNTRPVAIGQPIANTQVHILDQNHNPIPLGIPGELCISGAGLARGYLNRPELTAEKFIPNPFSDDPSARLYKTGDLARYLPDGNIEYLGRIDTQVKLRGFRIELGEIEAILTQHEAVKEAVVIVREDSPGDKRLIGYVILRSGRSETASQLRQFLKDKLPEYMVPSTIVFLEALPLTPNGKINRRALPKPDYLEAKASFVAPRNDTELQLQRLWEEILQVRLMNVTQNFFEAGGHSLLAIQLISRIRSTLNVELPLRTLFEHPTIADLATHLNTLQHLHLPPIQLIDKTENIPLSFAQQRLWFLDQLEGPSSTYNLPLALRLHGTLNVTALQKSLIEIIQRHESLRTTFLNHQGTPYQVLHPLTELWAKQQVLSVIEQPQLDPESLLQQEAQRPFDLEQGPLFRTTLYTLGHEENLFLIVMHHIISDGWSIKNFTEELTRLYETFTQELPPHLPPLPLQYADFAHWQRQWLTETILNLQLQYWKQKLANFPRLKLPTDRPRPTVQNYQGAKQILTLPKTLTEALKALSHQEHATPFMTLLAGFKLLLARYSGQEDILLGTPLATRNRSELEGMIGIFLNNLVLRTDLSGHPSFRTLLRRVRQSFLEAHAHQDLPFEKLVEELQPERDLSKHPIFEVMFNFINIPPTEFKLSGLQIHELELAESNSKFLMTLYVKEQDHQFILTLVYQREVFSTEYIATFLSQYQYLLEQIVATPDASIRSYSLVTLESQSYLPNPRVDLVESTHEPITTLFNQWAQSIPMHPAICQPGRQTWTYGELAERAEALAQLLLAHPIKRGEVVAIFGSRSFGVIASMIGIFLAGGVLLTLEKSIPKFRQQLMLKEAQAKLLLYFDEMSPEEAWLKESLATLYINPNSGQTLHAMVQVRLPWPALAPENAAYIFFTSGSTGVPKGILGCHKGLAHFLTWQRQTFSVGPSDHCAQLTKLSFDVVLRDIFLPLSSGATLYLPPEGDELEPARIFSWLEQEEISLLHIVPSLVQSWLTRVPPRISLRHLRRIFFAGEPLQESLVRQWYETFPEAGEVINLYGPTETTLAKCYFRVPKPPLFGIQPVGFPLPETQALVLSEEGRLCGVGESGEIVLRTPFRSLGYINALPEQQRRFVKSPFSDDERDILYYTGDRGRYRPEGLLEILGRFDHQVKVRGIRIELEEIETWLSQHVAVQSGVVHVWKAGEEAQLVAYVVLKPGRVFAVEVLRNFLKQHLPEFMLPSVFMVLEALPLTATGKVNRLALPQPEVFIEQAETFVAPRNDIELQLQRIWEEVLQVRPIGVTQNFFEVGGHSLLAIRLLNQIEKNFGQGSLPLIALFQSPSIAQQAKILSQGSHLVQWRTLEIIQPQGSLPPLFFFSPTEYILSLTTTLGTDQPIYKLNPLGLLGLYKEISSLDQVTQQYIQEIKMIQAVGPYYLAGFCGQAKVVLETARQLSLQGDEVAFLGLIHAIPYYPPWSLFHHWLKLRKTGFSYIKQRVQNKLRFLTKPLFSSRPREVAWANAKYYNKAPDQQSLNDLEYKQFVDSFFYTLNRYTPSPSYSGEITIFYQSEIRSALFVEIELARSVAAGKIEVYEIPAKWNDDLFVSPQAEILGAQLKQCLEKARMFQGSS